jgi:hypothetical protein
MPPPTTATSTLSSGMQHLSARRMIPLDDRGEAMIAGRPLTDRYGGLRALAAPTPRAGSA